MSWDESGSYRTRFWCRFGENENGAFFFSFFFSLKQPDYFPNPAVCWGCISVSTWILIYLTYSAGGEASVVGVYLEHISWSRVRVQPDTAWHRFSHSAFWTSPTSTFSFQKPTVHILSSYRDWSICGLTDDTGNRTYSFRCRALRTWFTTDKCNPQIHFLSLTITFC